MNDQTSNSSEDRDSVAGRLKKKNWIVFVILLILCVLFFSLTLLKITQNSRRHTLLMPFVEPHQVVFVFEPRSIDTKPLHS